MNKGLLFVFTLGVLLSASSAHGANKRPKPPVTLSPPFEFSSTPSELTSTTVSTPEPTTTTEPTTTKPTTTKPTTTKPTTTKPTTTKPTTTKPTTTKPTTTKPTTTTHAPNTTTHAPNTTTHAPNTTTHAPNTTTHAPNTTTHAPTTTAPPAPTPPAPTPTANVTVGNYTIKSGKGLCLMAQMALQIKVVDAGKTGVFVVQPALTKVEGDCKETTANLTLKFKEGFVTFLFLKNTTQNVVFVNSVSFKLNYQFVSEGNIELSPPYSAKNDSLELFPAASRHSYSCKNVSVFMGNGLYLDISQDRMQAFDLIDDRDFGATDPCPADRPDYRVAIAVGIVLLILIIIVVVAYFLSRRRRADGYQSL